MTLFDAIVSIITKKVDAVCCPHSKTQIGWNCIYNCYCVDDTMFNNVEDAVRYFIKKTGYVSLRRNDDLVKNKV